MSVGAVAWALKQDLKPLEKIVLIVIANESDGFSGELAAPLSAIARVSRVSVKTAYRAIMKLCELGYVEKRSEFSGNLQKQNTYNIGPSFGREGSLFSLGQFDRPAEAGAGRNCAGLLRLPLGQIDRVEEGFNESPEQQEQPVVAPVICNSNLSNARRKKRAYLDENPPTPEEWLERAKTDPRVMETLMPLVEAEQAYDWYVAHGWCQKDGGRLVDWPALIRRWARSWKAKNPQAYIAAKRDLETTARAAQPFVSEIAQIKARQREAAARSGA